MRRDGPGSRRASRALAAWLVALCLGSAGAGPAESRQDEVVRLYDEGRYDEALPILEALDAAGTLGGPLLYRLYYCRRLADDPRTAETLNRARTRLEQELGTGKDLEVPFYLVNVYQSLGLNTTARQVATESTGRVESGELPEPASGIEMFRLAKLYADQERSDDATRWYARAVPALSAEGTQHAAYLVWASRHLAEPAFVARDWPAAAEHYRRVAAANLASAEDYDRLATALVHVGEYGEASVAWRQAARLNPALSDRARYGAALAKMASVLPELPTTAPAGRALDELGQDELNSLMLEQAGALRAILAEAQEQTPLSADERAEFKQRIAVVRPLFVAAALQFTLRGYGIRESAFFGGYAPLILRPRSWRLPKAGGPAEPAGPVNLDSGHPLPGTSSPAPDGAKKKDHKKEAKPAG